MISAVMAHNRIDKLRLCCTKAKVANKNHFYKKCSKMESLMKIEEVEAQKMLSIKIIKIIGIHYTS